MREVYVGDRLRNFLRQKNTVFSRTNTFVEIKKYVKSDCPACRLDPVKKESMNLGCSTCKGSGYVITTKKVKLPVVNLNRGLEVGNFNEAGVYSTDNCSVILNLIDYGRNKDYLQEKHKIFVDKSPYEILSVRSIGVGHTLFMKLECQKISEEVAGNE